MLSASVLLSQIGIETIVWFVFGAIIIAAILGLLWWLIGYCEGKIPNVPMVWTCIRIAFVILVVFLLIAILLGLLGRPIVRL